MHCFRPVDERCHAETFDCEEPNPCSPELCTPGKNYYPAHDITQFVQCGVSCLVQRCSPGTKWDDNQETCVLM